MEQPGSTLLAKISDQQAVAHIGDGADLLHLDRPLLHGLGSSRALLDLNNRGLPVPAYLLRWQNHNMVE